jgi:hypothetical protein
VEEEDGEGEGEGEGVGGGINPLQADTMLREGRSVMLHPVAGTNREEETLFALICEFCNRLEYVSLSKKGRRGDREEEEGRGSEGENKCFRYRVTLAELQ